MPTGGPGRWATASELGEYAYCPRAWWYRASLGDDGPEPERAEAGRVFHERSLSGVRRRATHRAGYAAVLALGIVLAVLALGALALLR